MAFEITDANFEQIVANSDKPIMIDFWATWCGPCLAIAPVIEEMAHEYEGKAIVAKLDVDSNPNASMAFGVRNIPTILFFKDGKVVDKHVGAAPKNILVKKLDAQLS
jgi:thioredoxin 1